MEKNIKSRMISVWSFSFLFAYLLSFVFEGRVLYSIAEYFVISSTKFIFAAIIAHFVGLFCCGLVVKTLENAKKTMLYGIGISFVCSLPFFFKAPLWWAVALMGCALVSGGAVAAWGYFLKSCTPKNERLKSCADVLIYSNILMIIINLAAIHISPFVGLSLSLLALVISGYYTIMLPVTGEAIVKASAPPKVPSLKRPMLYLALFVVIITINSGLMYQVFNPAFEHLTWLTSWYWAFPYIVALIIMRNMPNRIKRAYFLYIGMTMIIAAFIAFMLLDRSAAAYFVVNTLMLGACGIFDLFWWSIIGEMLEFSNYPARIFGIGLSANVLGVLLGGILGFNLYSLDQPSANVAVIALVVVCVTLIILPPLNFRLGMILKNHTYLKAYSIMEDQQQKQILSTLETFEPLTRREHEILGLILQGKTNKHIAAELYISENTVKTHVKNILSKHRVASRAELISTILQKQIEV